MKAPIFPLPPAPLAVIGGDARMAHAASRLCEAGYSVRLLGCGETCLPSIEESAGALCLSRTLEAAVTDAAAILLPLPATRDGENVHCPRDPACRVTFCALSALLDRRPALCLFGGRLPVDWKAAYPSAILDYYDLEALQLRNAYITAEGAISTAMSLYDGVLRGTSVAVVGYGRIGKLLCRLLLALGAEVTVAARRGESLLWAATDGCHPLRMGDTSRPGGGLYPLCHGHPIIFNTVPARVLDRDLLTKLEPGTLILDLASAPFGVSDEDLNALHSGTLTHDLRYLRAPSIPGTYAPREAGRAIAEALMSAGNGLV